MSPSLTRGSSKLTLGKESLSIRSRTLEVRPAVVGIVVIELELRAGAERVRHPVAVEVHEAHVRRVEIDRRHAAVAHESSLVPLAVEGQRVIAVAQPVDHHQIGPAIAVGVEQLHARLAQPHPCRSRLHGAHEVEPAIAAVAPVAHLLVELQHGGQTVAEQIDQLVFRDGRASAPASIRPRR